MKRSKEDSVREKAFHQALTSGDLAAVSKFLDEGFSANYQSENMPSPMATAINKDNVALVQLLLQRGYEINQPLAQLSLRTALMRALEEMSHRGATCASPVFESLLTAGADVNARDKYGATLAHLVAAGKNDKDELLARLCTMGLRLDVTDNFGETPFIEANRNGNLKCAEFLLQKGADVNQRGRNKKTALIVAGQRGLLEVCQWLVSKGADLHAKDEFNKTALDWARANGHTKVVEFLEQQLAATGAPVAPPVPSAPTQAPGQHGDPAASRTQAGQPEKPGGFLRSLKRVFEPARKPAPEVPPHSPNQSTAMNVKPQIQESGRFASATCWCNKPVCLPVAGGGALELEADEFIPYQFSFGVKAAGEEVDYLRSIVRLADEAGTVWEAESIWRPGWFLGRITDFGRMSAPAPQEEAEAELVRALEESWFVRGARDLLDDRFYRELWLGGQRYAVPFKYQSPVVDLAAHPPDEDDDCASAGVVVRVTGLYGLAGEASGEKLELPAIVFTVDVSERLFVNYFFEEDEGAWGDQEIPEIVSFCRTNLKREANEGVRFLRDE